jgi:hypothetical protein
VRASYVARGPLLARCGRAVAFSIVGALRSARNPVTVISRETCGFG